MGHDALHEPFRQTLATPGFQHEYIGQIGEGGPVGDYPGEADLIALVINAKAEGVFYRALYCCQRNSPGPVRVGKKLVHFGDVNPLRIGADFKIAVDPGLNHQLACPVGAPVLAASCSMAAIFSTRRSCRPPANWVVSHVSTMRKDSSAPRILAPRASTFALLCSRLICASCSVVTLAARIPWTLFAAMAMPMPLPHTRIPMSERPALTFCPTRQA